MVLIHPDLFLLFHVLGSVPALYSCFSRSLTQPFSGLISYLRLYLPHISCGPFILCVHSQTFFPVPLAFLIPSLFTSNDISDKINIYQNHVNISEAALKYENCAYPQQ